MNQNIKSQIWKNQFNTPLYSPRTTYSNHLKQINLLKINMIINIDKYILGNLKNQFQKRGKQITKLEFIYFCKKYLKDWNTELYGRDIKIYQSLLDIWQQIDLQSKGKVTWEEFNSKIIQTGLNLKSLSNNAGIQAPSFKQLHLRIPSGKFEHPIAKLINIKGKNKIAYFRQQSIDINFMSTDSQNNQSSVTKTLIIPQQELKVQTIVKVKQRSDKSQKNKHSKLIKKDVKVSSYKNIVIDAIFIDDPKYDMLIVSCSDKYIRGYNITNVNPVIGCQPENQDQLMIHQFPVQIYSMAWDSINEVLYATGKHPKIYQWLIKTDSEREMFDYKAHQKMISCMFMMPKLQLLATGGYDGRLILWDTVGQVIKCKYEEHTRAISGITFHQGLILLFTSSYDHKICIWNPYITSLIHKIENSLNIISIEIIPNTNYLLSLDSGGNVKVRQLNRFTHITSFSIFRSENLDDNQTFNKINAQKDKQVGICMCSKSDGPIQYYFGTQKILGYQYFEIQKSSIHGGNHLCMHYLKNTFSMYTPVKNHIAVWDFLSGKISEIFYDVSQNDISSIEFIEELDFFIVGDFDGNLSQRKISNGFFIKNLYKFKSAITSIKIHQVQRNQKQKHLKKTYLLFCGTQQCQIVIFKCQAKTQFEQYRYFSLKKDFDLPNSSNLNDLQYFGPKNILLASLSTNQIVFVDIQKKNMLIKLSLGLSSIIQIDIINFEQTNFLTVLCKNSQLTGLYLPPHTKKFKTSCLYILEDIQKIQASVYSQKNQSFYISTELNQLYCMKLNKNSLENEKSKSSPNSSLLFKSQWKIKLQNRIKKMILIQNDQILVVLNQVQNFSFISTQNGQNICELKQEKHIQSFESKQPAPILYFKQKTEQIYIPNEENTIKLYEEELKQNKIERIIDPFYFVNFLKDKNMKNFSRTSNPAWTLNLNFNKNCQKRIQQIHQIQSNLNSFGLEFQKKRASVMQKKISKALDLQKKWQKQKQNQNEAELTQSISKKREAIQESRNSLNLNSKNLRGSSLASLWKYKEGLKKAQEPLKKDNFNHKQFSQPKFKRNFIKEIDLSHMKDDPLYRLGLALKSVNQDDKKAQNFIELARKKQSLKFPKLDPHKIKF